MSEVKKIVLDGATKEKMFGLLPMTKNAVDNYTPKVYEESGVPAEFHPTFKLKQLTNEDAQAVKILSVNEVLDSQKKGTKKTAESLILKADQKKASYASIVYGCIVGWSNFYNMDGELIEYNGDCTIIPDIVVEDLLLRIIKISGFKGV